jgi:multiple sugar transport system permease protein
MSIQTVDIRTRIANTLGIETLTISLIYAGLLSYAAITLVPPLWMVMMSFKQPNDVFNMPPSLFSGWTLSNYDIVFLQSSYPQFLLNSVFIVSLTMAATLVLGIAAGYALSRFDFTASEDIQFFALTTRMGPPIAFGLPLYVLFADLGLIDTYTGMTIIYILMNLAFAIWMMKGFFDEIPAKLEEAAQMDGYSRVKAFLKVALPMAKPGIFATAIFVFIFSWNEFFYALLLTNITAKPYTVQLLAFQGAYRPLWSQMFAAATVAVIPPVLFAIIVRNKLARGLTFGQVK